MRIILHMGQGKTGTTALQHMLAAARGALAERGVLYPEMAPGAVAHHLLIALCEGPDRLPPHVALPFGGAEATRRAALEGLARIGAEAARTKPDLIVLSSETLVFGTTAEGKVRLARLLASLTGDIRPVLYLREPAGLYLARLQERAKVAATPLPPGPQPIRAALEDTEAAFGRPPELGAYDPAALAGGDIVTDFAARFLPGRIDPALLPPRRLNQGLSAEATLLMARFRALVAPGRDWQADPRGTRLISLISRIEAAQGGGQRARLVPGLAAAIRRASVDYLWLRDRFGLSFPEIDYRAIDGAALPESLGHAPIKALIKIDDARYGALLLRLVAALLEEPAP